MIEIKSSLLVPGQRGVFATVDIPKGTEFESSPVLIMKAADEQLLDNTDIAGYVFAWGDDIALAAGTGTFLNHSYRPNSAYYDDPESLTMRFYTLRDVTAGTELNVNYNGDPEDQAPLYFEVLTETEPPRA